LLRIILRGVSGSSRSSNMIAGLPGLTRGSPAASENIRATDPRVAVEAVGVELKKVRYGAQDVLFFHLFVFELFQGGFGGSSEHVTIGRDR